MGFLRNILQKFGEKFKRNGTFKEAYVTWKVSMTYSKKNLNKFEKLLKKGKKYYNLIKFRENNCYSLLHQLIHDRDKEAIQIILSQPYTSEIIDDCNNDLSISPLQMSCVIDDLDLFQLLEQKGANVNLPIEQQNLHLLHISAHHGSLKILDYIYKKYFGRIIDVLSAENWTPLHYACFQNKMDIVSYLIDCNANLYVRNKQLMTPLDLAILQDNFDLFQALYEFHYDKSKFSNMEV
jgi:ankyrin repeat protein